MSAVTIIIMCIYLPFLWTTQSTSPEFLLFSGLTMIGLGLSTKEKRGQ